MNKKKEITPIRSNDNHNPDAQNKIAMSVYSYSGPLPSPEVLQKYKEINPDAPKIIFDLFQEQTEHRINIETKVVKSNTFRATLGTLFAFILGMTMILGGVFLLYNDKNAGGYFSMATGIFTLAGSFIYATKKNSEERKVREANRLNPQKK